jgi:hypothetical protein
MLADIHDGQEQRSNQRPDTLMQDRSPPTRQGSLATRGRTIHWVKSVTSAAPADVRFAPESDHLLRCRAITRCSDHHAVRLDQHYVAMREDERPLVRDLIRGLTILTDLCQKGSCVR